MGLSQWVAGIGGSRESVYFGTWRVSSWQPALTEAERDAVSRVLCHRKDQGCSLLSFVVMDDHVHVLVRCSPSVIGRVLETWKSFSAHRLREVGGRSGAIWQHDTFHREIRDEGDLRARANYIAGNPWKRWPFVERYPWVWESGSRSAMAHIEPRGVVACVAGILISAVR